MFGMRFMRAASATALAAIDVAKTKNKIVVLNGPGAARITNEACTPVSIHYTYDNYALAHGTGGAMVKAGYDTWFFVTADYAFGHGALKIINTMDAVRHSDFVFYGQQPGKPLSTMALEMVLRRAAAHLPAVRLDHVGSHLLKIMRLQQGRGEIRRVDRHADAAWRAGRPYQYALPCSRGRRKTYGAEYPDTLPALLTWSERNASAPAVTDAGATLIWRAFQDRVLRVAIDTFWWNDTKPARTSAPVVRYPCLEI
jgi:hypothetical protein